MTKDCSNSKKTGDNLTGKQKAWETLKENCNKRHWKLGSGQPHTDKKLTRKIVNWIIEPN